jgi:WD40 repeat protein
MIFYQDCNDIRAMAFSPDGRILATGGGIGIVYTPDTVCLWDVPNRTKIRCLPALEMEIVDNLQFSSDGAKLYVLLDQGKSHKMKIWDMTANKFIRESNDWRSAMGGPRRIAKVVSPDGTMEASVHSANIVLQRVK